MIGIGLFYQEQTQRPKVKINRERNPKFCLLHEKEIEGHQKRKCSDCKIIYGREWRRTEKGIKYGQEYYKKAHSKSNSEYARSRVSVNVKNGKIRPAKDFICVDCGKNAEVYDHRDYNKPLDVVPVCRKCNKKRGAGLNAK